MANDKLTANLNLNTDGFAAGLESANKQLKGFGAVLGALGGAVKLVGDAFRNMDQGQRIASLGASIYKQQLAELTKGHLLNAQALVASARAQGEWNDIQEKNLWEGLQVAKLTTQIEDLRYQMADAMISETEKTKLAGEALKIYNERKRIQLENYKEEALAIGKQLALNPDDKELRQRAVSTLQAWQNLMGFDREARMLAGQATKTEEKLYGLADAFERDRQSADAATEAFNKYRQSLQYLETGYKLEKIPGKETVTTGRKLGFNIDATKLPLANMVGADIPTDQIVQQNKLWAEQEQIILSLADSFSRMFSRAGEGFQTMVQMVIAGIKRMVVELIAKAAILGLLSLFMPGKGIFSLANLIPGLAGLVGGGKGGGGGINTNQAPVMRFQDMRNPINDWRLTSQVSGSSLKLVLDRSARISGAGT
jgi:hypothetical protein